MDNYLSRLASFFSFPFTSPVSTTSLAESGFHYTGHKDEVLCHRCNLRYSGWQKHDEPMVIHKTMSPNCTFMLNTDGKTGHGNHCNLISLPSDTVNQQRKAESAMVDGSIGRQLQSVQQDQTVSGQQSAAAGCRETDDSLFATKSTDVPQAYAGTDSNLMPASANSSSSTSQVNGQLMAGVDGMSLKGGNNEHPPVEQAVDSLLPEIRRSGEDFPNTVMPGHDPASDTENHHGIDSHTSQGMNGLNVVRPRYPELAVLAVRLTSYLNWPTHLRQKPDDLAKAGLFYEGSSDHVRCFHCAGGLREWDPEDDPLIEHARWFPFCEFMRLIKGDRFIMGVQAGTIKSEYQVQSEKPEAPKEEGSYDDPAVLSVMEMGYNRATIAKAIKVFNKRKGKTLSAEILLSIVWDIEENDEDVSDDEHNSKTNEKVQDEFHKEVDDEKRDYLVSGGKGMVQDVDQLKEENQSLRDRKTCKVCLDEEASIVFLPCGHLVTCPMCAAALRKCPICRTFIRGTVKAIVS